MIKVIAADDEQYLRDALPNLVPWDELGAELIMCAKNGMELVGAVDKNRPDIVITDIRMPVMDGIEVCKYIYEKYPQIKVIVLSAYSDFSYARNAMKYDVSEYILKADVVEELTPAIKRIIEQINPQGGVEKEVVAEKKEQDLFNDMSDYISIHYREDISLTDIAQYLHANSSYLSRLYKTRSGINIFDDILNRRIEKSKECLLVTDMKINDIAEYVGFNDASYFSRAFKKVCGVTPREYREQRTN